MPWFPVDDTFHSHPKRLATSAAALGLWVVAGSWSNAHLTDGRVPDHVLPLLLPDAATLADELVSTGLWKRTRGGYVFRDWLEWGSKRTAAQVRALRQVRAEAGRKGGLASADTRSKQAANGEANASRLLEPPALPSPIGTGSSGTGRHARARDDKPHITDSAATRHPSNRTVTQAAIDAGLEPGRTPASDDTIAAATAAIRQHIARGDT